MLTFENKHLIAFTDEELDNLCAMCNAAWLFWHQKAKNAEKRGVCHESEDMMEDIASDYWQKLYRIKVGD